MIAADDQLQFAPPAPPGFVRAFGLALVAHAVLLLALAWGVNWKTEPVTLAAEAELWSAVPQEAAPPAVADAPQPAPEPAPPLPATPAPAVVPPTPAPPPEPPAVSQADIALDKEKAQQKKEHERQLALEKQRAENLKKEQQRLEKLKLEKQRLEALEKQKQDKLKQAKLAQEKAAAEKRELEEQRARDKKRDEAKKLKDQEAARQQAVKAKEDAAQMEAQRQANLKRMAGLAGATGSDKATGNALRSSGPSAGYAGRIRARIKPNIVFTEEVSNNPLAEVEVRTSPDGTILQRKLIKSSGMATWDEAVLKAIDKTVTLPRDTDGQVPPTLIISFRPKD